MSAPSASTAVLPTFVRAGRYAGSGEVPAHTHDGHELVLVTDGVGTCAVGDWVLQGEPGSLWVLPAGVPQLQRAPRTIRTAYVIFTVPEKVFDASPRTIAVKARAERWFNDVVQLTEERAPQLACSGVLLSILCELDASAPPRTTRTHPAAAARAIEWLERTYTEQRPMRQLAEYVGASPSHLRALFTAAIGMAPMDYREQLRFEHAQRLLRNSDVAVKEVALSSGFRDPNYFVRAFRARYGQTPGRWRDAEGSPRP